jgi:hypothetical protein
MGGTTMFAMRSTADFTNAGNAETIGLRSDENPARILP